MPKPPELLVAFDDPDFGRIERWRSHGRVLPKGHIFDKPYTQTDWKGAARLPSGQEFKLAFEGDFDETDFGVAFGPKIRATFAAILANEPALRRRIAEHLAEVIESTQDDFANGLTLDTAELSSEPGYGVKIEFWYETDEFGDHAVRAIVDEGGTLIEVE